MADAVGAFMVSALLVTLAGAVGWFERAMNRIPQALASALLAGGVMALVRGPLTFGAMPWELATPVFTMPSLRLADALAWAVLHRRD